MGRHILDNKNGLERHHYYNGAIPDNLRHNYHPVSKGIIKRLLSSNQTMEAKLVVILSCMIGYPSAILAFASNMGWIIIGNWQASVLFWLGALFFFLKIIVYCIRQYQSIRKAEDDWKRQQKKQDDEIFS